jgi:glycerol-3-phosphate dehydrogenase
VGSERAIVHKLARHLVLPEKMLLPLVEHGSYGKWLTSVGLKVYDILAKVVGDDQRKMLNKTEALELEPLLPKKIVKGAGYYAEYRTDDARLTLEIIKTALRFKATAINYTKAVQFKYEQNKINALIVKDQVSKKMYTIKARCVVNATGPWVDEVRESQNDKAKKQLHLTKGVHLVFPHHKLPIKQSVYFDVPDGRMIFAIPRENCTYVGTTDTNYYDSKEDVKVDLADVTYLLSAVNNMFAKVNLQLEDVVSSWAGLRPLIHEEGKAPSELSRKDEIFTSKTGLISIAGGKLTGYRKMAERVVNKVAKKLKEDFAIKIESGYTEIIPICGNDFNRNRHVNRYIKSIYRQLKDDGFTETDAAYLVHHYGIQTDRILKYYTDRKHPDAQQRLILAEYKFCSEFEMIQTPTDFLIRRTGRLYFNIESVKKYLEPILELHQETFSATEEEIAVYRKIMLKEIKTCSEFKLS